MILHLCIKVNRRTQYRITLGRLRYYILLLTIILRFVIYGNNDLDCKSFSCYLLIKTTSIILYRISLFRLVKVMNRILRTQ